MRIFAIADLHLSFSVEKPMDVFGDAWADHTERLKAAWTEEVGADDLVLIPGDISWAMALPDAAADLVFIDALPGKKILLRGNHDYWWSSYQKVKSILPESIEAIQNNALMFNDIAIGGTRGWLSPANNAFTAADQKIYDREIGRLQLSLGAMPQSSKKLVMLHFPPLDDKQRETPVSYMLEQYGVSDVVYGHLHGAAHKAAFVGEKNGVRYHFAAADYLGFSPLRIL